MRLVDKRLFRFFKILLNIRLHLILSVLFLSSCATKTPSPSLHSIPTDKARESSLIAVEFLRQDIDQLVRNVINIHPEPFALVSKDDFVGKAEKIKQSLRYPLSRSEFFIRIAPLVAQLRDIHSQIKLPKYSPEQYLDGLKLFPLAVLYEKGGLYVAADLSHHPQIQSGAQITAINDAPVEYLLDVMQRLTASETSAGMRRRIQVDFPWLLWAMGYANTHYRIEYLSELTAHSVELEGLVPREAIKPHEEDLTLDQSQNLDERPIKPSVASFYGASRLSQTSQLLWFNDFREQPDQFKQFLEQAFAKMERGSISNLIIDVRYNDGGLSQNIKTLLSFISEKPIYWSQQGEIKTSAALKRLHQRRTKQRRKNKYQWGLQWLPLEWTDTLQYEISWSDRGDKVEVDFEAIEPRPGFKPAQVFLLVNGFCYSACSSLVATANHYSLAQTIGELSGNFARVQYAYPILEKLNNSGLELMLPTMKLNFLRNEKDRKAIMNEATSLIKPQIPLLRSQQNIKQQQDIVLMKALEIISNK